MDADLRNMHDRDDEESEEDELEDAIVLHLAVNLHARNPVWYIQFYCNSHTEVEISVGNQS